MISSIKVRCWVLAGALVASLGALGVSACAVIEGDGVNENLATADAAPESSETVAVRAVGNAGARALSSQLTGSVTEFEWTASTLQIFTSNPLLDLIQVKTAAGSSTGTYNTATASAKLAIDAANLTNLRNTISVGMNV